MTEITPCFWSDGTADEAVAYYLSIFPDPRRITGSKYGPHTAGQEGTASIASFELDDRPFMALSGGLIFRFTPAISFVINREMQARSITSGIDWSKAARPHNVAG